MPLHNCIRSTTVEGRERYGVNIRYPRDLRSNLQSIATDVEVPLPGGGAIPLGEVAKVQLTRGATSIRTENGQLATYIFVDINGRDLGGYVADAQKGSEQEQCEIVRGLYQPKTATADLITMPPSGLQRI